MKKILSVVLLLTTVVVFGQRKPKIKGSKTVVEINKVLPSFNAIELVDDLKIKLNKSREESYSFVGDDNLLDVLKFDVKDSILFISSFYKITSKKKLDITINYIGINSILMHNGHIEAENILVTDYIEIQLKDNATIALNAQAVEAEIKMMDGSKGDMNMDCEVLKIKLEDKSKLNLYAVVDNIQLNMFTNTNLEIEGTTTNFNFNVLGNSRLKAEQFKSSITEANLDESSQVKIFVTDTLGLSANGSSKTYLYGNPKINITDFLGTSELLKKE